MISSSKKRLDLFGQRARGFAELYLWLMPDLIKSFWMPLLLLVSVAGTFIAARTFLAASLVSSLRSIDVSFLSGNETILAGGFLELSIVQFIILGWVAITLTALIGFIYYYLIFWVARLHLDLSFSRLLTFYVLPARFGSSLSLNDKEYNQFIKLALTNARLTSVLLRIVLLSAFEMISTVTCFFILLYINWQMTLMITFSVVPFIPVFYILSLDGIRKRRAMVPAFTEVASELADLSNTLMTGTESKLTLKTLVAKRSKSESIKTAFDLFQSQRIVIFKGEFAAGVLFATLICSALYVLHLISSYSDLQFVPYYLGILMVMLYSLGRCLKSITSSNRFMDSAQFLYRITAAELPNLDPAPSDSWGSNSNLYKKFVYRRAGKKPGVQLRAGDVLVYQRPQRKSPLYLLPLSNRLILPKTNLGPAYLKAVQFVNVLPRETPATDSELEQSLEAMLEDGIFPVVHLQKAHELSGVLKLESIRSHLSKFPLVVSTMDRPVNASNYDSVRAVVWTRGWKIEEDWAHGDKTEIPPQEIEVPQNNKSSELDDIIDEELM